MGGGNDQLVIGGEAVQRLRKAFPRQTALEKKAETIINEWLEDRDAIKAANASEKRSAGKPTIRAQDLFEEWPQRVSASSTERFSARSNPN